MNNRFMMVVFAGLLGLFGMGNAMAITSAEVTDKLTAWEPILTAVGLGMIGLVLILVLFRLIRGLF